MSFSHKPDDFARLGVAPQLQLGEDLLVVQEDLEAASRPGGQGEAFDLGLEILDQVGCQAHGPVGVVSDHAVFNADFHYYHSS